MVVKGWLLLKERLPQASLQLSPKAEEKEEERDTSTDASV
jgi:hypothetical protein